MATIIPFKKLEDNNEYWEEEPIDEPQDDLLVGLELKIINFYEQHFCGSAEEIETRIDLHLGLFKEMYFLRNFPQMSSYERAAALDEIHRKTEKICDLIY